MRNKGLLFSIDRSGKMKRFAVRRGVQSKTSAKTHRVNSPIPFPPTIPCYLNNRTISDRCTPCGSKPPPHRVLETSSGDLAAAATAPLSNPSGNLAPQPNATPPTRDEKIGILPLWEADFAGMPSKLWASLECPYEGCSSR